MTGLADLPLAEVLLLAGGLLATGLVSGFLAGLLGIGSGTVIVPVLTEMFLLLGVANAYSYKLAVGTSLAIMVPTSLRSFFRHRAKGAVDNGLLKTLLLPVILGVIFGGFMSRYATSNSLQAIFALVVLLISVYTFISRPNWTLGNHVPKGWLCRLIGVVIGFVSSIMGIGGGVFVNSFMTLYGASIHRAVATASGVGVFIALPGIASSIIAGYDQSTFLPPFSLGYVSLLALLAVVPTSVLIAPLGVYVAHRLPAPLLKRAFSLFLFCVAVRFIWRLVG